MYAFQRHGTVLVSLGSLIFQYEAAYVPVYILTTKFWAIAISIGNSMSKNESVLLYSHILTSGRSVSVGTQMTIKETVLVPPM